MTSGPSHSRFSANYTDTSVVLLTSFLVVLHLHSDTGDDVTELT